MNYWLVTTEYPPQSGGGISTYCYHTAKMLTHFGHKVTVFVPGGKNKKPTIQSTEDGVTVVRFQVIHYEHFGYEAALSYTISILLEDCLNILEEPSVIEFQEYNGIGYYTLQKKWLYKNYFKNTLFLVTAHAPSYLYLEYNQAPRYSFPEYWIGEMEKNVLASADIVISPSQFLIDKLDIKRSNLHHIFNPYEYQTRGKEEVAIEDIVFFGKLTPQKGAIEMLAYFEEAWRSGKKYRLNIIGGGEHYFYPKKQDLGEYMKSKYAHRTKEGLLNFEGHIAPSKLAERLSKAHIVLVPSIVDNLPYTVIEAMTLKKIVLASTDGGHKELIENAKNGFLFNHGDPESFISQIETILSLSEEEIKKIGEIARETIKLKCSYQRVYDHKMHVIDSYTKSDQSDFPFLRQVTCGAKVKDFHTQKDLLSIVIPYYNMGKYVIKCLESIQNNEYDKYEVILVNDGSTHEESLKVLNELGHIENLKVYHKENSGLSDTRNYGANIANGEFIAFLDPDDYVEPHYYRKAIEVLERYKNVSFVGCWAQYFGSKNYVWPSFNPEPPYLLTHNTINSSAIIVRKNDYLNFGQNDIKFIYGMEDYDSIINLVKNGKNGVVIPECLWNYRIRSGSLAQSFNKFSKEYLYTLLSHKHSEFYSQYAKDVVNLLNANGPGMNFDNPTKKLGIFQEINLPFNNSKIINSIKSSRFLRKIAKQLYSKLIN